MKNDKMLLRRACVDIVNCLSADQAGIVFKWLVKQRAGEKRDVTPLTYDRVTYIAFKFFRTLESLSERREDE